MAKTTAKTSKNPTRPAPEPKEAASGGTQKTSGAVSVRMYRHGLGDCFLLTFAGAGGKPFYMMIDCGVILGTPDAATKMTAVAEDIAKVTGGRLDLVVATHEHWDHISGFVQVKDFFESKSKTNRVWLGWTEDKSNPLARRLLAQRQHSIAALRATAERMRGLLPEAAECLDGVLGFFGATGAGSTADALDIVRGLAKSPRYCHPKDAPMTLPELPGVRFYVLGPPEDETLIRKSNPSKSHPEVYEDKALALDLETGFFAAALEGVKSAESHPYNDPVLRALSFPFDKCAHLTPAQAKDSEFFQRYYFGHDPDAEKPEYRDQSWRRIDADWLDMANQLGLQLDSDTNNTSLVLAIELIESGRVLLFAADAQVGNWLSWSDLSWKVDGKTVTGPDLLQRTVLYKVGHHGSHNATLREKGLEEMVCPDLIAMIPVNHEMAVKKRWVGMPFPPLLSRLEEKTGGRVLRIDDPQPLEKRKAPGGTALAKWKDFQSAVAETPLYYELRID